MNERLVGQYFITPWWVWSPLYLCYTKAGTVIHTPFYNQSCLCSMYSSVNVKKGALNEPQIHLTQLLWEPLVNPLGWAMFFDDLLSNPIFEEQLLFLT